jgi:carboxylate-amine ligase
VEHAFGREAPFALGIEEELLLVHPATLRLAGGASDLVARVTAAAGAVAEDVYQALIEVSTPVVGSAAEGHDALAALRDELRAAGATLLGAGLHPDGAFGDVEHIVSPRYEAIRADMRGLLARTPTAALHVHVGMPDPETAIDVCNRLRAHLPLLQALAAHSPYWHGRDSGFASARSMLFRGFPRAIIPPAFAGWEHYADFVGWWEQTADVPDCTYLWWDLRPSPRLGTVEVRAMDAQSRLGSSGGHRRPRARAGAGVRGRPRGAHAPVGGAHRILVPGRARRRRRHRVVARPYARELDGEDALEEVERILREGGGATACARPTPPAGWTGCSPGWPPRRPPTPRPRRRRRAAASRRSAARPGLARAGSRGWRCRAARRSSRGSRSRG